MELSEEQMLKLRNVELNILRNFIEVCGKLDISYFVIQGTLLGAVRHHGFIPWDDDIDVGMLREDYTRFLQYGQSLLLKQYFLQTHYSDPMYPHGFAKIRDCSTAFVETSCKNIKMNHGIYIDIFPFDYYPDNTVAQTVFELKKLILRYRIRDSMFIPSDKQKNMKNLVRYILKRGSKLLYPSLSAALDAQDDLYQRTKHGKNRINNGSPWGKKECIPNEWLNGITTLDFEGIPVNAPCFYKEYLTHVYGDYMTLPPPEKRIPHHYICALDFEHSYTV